MEAGLNVTVSTDDPPMFNTTLTKEYIAICDAYRFGADEVERLVLNGVRATLLQEAERVAMESQFRARLAELRVIHGV
jgi:adenosine deaminase